MLRIFLSFALLFSQVVTPSFARAIPEEGMWDYTNLPTEDLKNKYQFEPTEEWTNHLMLSSVRISDGGSGSFVSSTGLVLTNHHVAFDTVEKVSTPEHDYVKDGFLAKTLAEEIPAPDLSFDQLRKINDVTAEVNAGVKPGMTDAEASDVRAKAIKEISAKAEKETGLTPEVVKLYNGGRYHLYLYKTYTDVRVVFAPEQSMAFFGGDLDNFDFPRYDFDMALFRVYEDGKPIQADNYLKINTAGAAPGELVFVSGHPGRTDRVLTYDAFKFNRDVLMPYRLEVLRRREIALQQYGLKGPEQKRRAKGVYFGVQNSRKARLGMISGLHDPNLMNAKQQDEVAFRSVLRQRPELQNVLASFDRISAAQKDARKLYVKMMLVNGGHAFNSTLYGIAKTIVNIASENRKPKKGPEEDTLYSAAPIFQDLEEAQLADSLGLLVEKLGPENSVVAQVMLNRSPKVRAAELANGTSLSLVSERKRLIEGGLDLVKASTDPMIQLALAVKPHSDAIGKLYTDKVKAIEDKGYAEITSARFQVYGTTLYPDATFTLRLAYGTVAGWEEAGVKYPPFTTIGGLFEHEDANATEPRIITQRWKDAKPNLNLDAPYNFVSTPDIIGGNSGSPVVNRAGELVGLIFDGNLPSTLGNYFYQESVNRATSVHTAAMMEGLRKVYGAGTLADELGH